MDEILMNHAVDVLNPLIRVDMACFIKSELAILPGILM